MKRISEELLAERLRAARGVQTYVDMQEVTGIDYRLMKRMEQKKYFPSRKHLRMLLETLSIVEEEITIEEPSVYTAMLTEAKTEAEREAFAKMIAMMECIHKYDGLEGEDYG